MIFQGGGSRPPVPLSGSAHDKAMDNGITRLEKIIMDIYIQLFSKEEIEYGKKNVHKEHNGSNVVKPV